MAPPKKAKRDKAPPPPDERVAIIHLKGSKEFADWLEDIHKETLIAKTAIVRDALKVWAKQRGLKVPPEF